MKTGALLARLAAVVVLLFAFGVSVYRAKAQPISHDEALTYNWLLDQGVYNVLRYNEANHVLQTLLAKPIVKFIGLTEFTLRMPTLFGSAIYLIAAFLLSRKLFGDGIVMVLCVAMLALNPQVMDFMAAARGYSLGLAGLGVAMYAIASLSERGKFDPEDNAWRRGLALASVCLALSVTANLTYIVPATSFVIVFTLVALGGPTALLKFRDRPVREFAKYFYFPGLAAGFCILWPFLIQARPSHFRVALNRASDAVRDIFAASFLARWTDFVFNSLGAVPPAPGSWQEKTIGMGADFFLPLLFCLVLGGLILAVRKRDESPARRNTHCRIFAGAAVTSVVLIVVLHVVLKIDYPVSRYCLFVVPQFTVAAFVAARELSSRIPFSFVRAATLLAAAAIVGDYALELNTQFFWYTAYDVITRDLFRAMEKDALSRGSREVRVGGTWWYEPEINFYRVRYRANWMLPYDIKDPSAVWQTADTPEPAAYDYFVFVPASDPHLTGPRVRTIFHDEKTRATIIAIDHSATTHD
jgi:hypothetical protein